MVNGKKVLLMIPILLMFILTGGTSKFAAIDKVYDHAHLFTDSQKQELQEKADLLSEQIALDLTIVTIDDNEGKTSRQYAEDYYHEFDFGYGETLDGILYLLNMDEREVYIFTRDRERCWSIKILAKIGGSFYQAFIVRYTWHVVFK